MSDSKFPSILMLEVTADDIRTGERGNPSACALAKALLRTAGGATAEVAVVDFDDIAVTVRDEDGDILEEAEYVGPKAITAYLNRFDNFGSDGRFAPAYRTDVKPTTFRLRRKAHYTPEPHVPEMR